MMCQTTHPTIITPASQLKAVAVQVRDQGRSDTKRQERGKLLYQKTNLGEEGFSFVLNQEQGAAELVTPGTGKKPTSRCATMNTTGYECSCPDYSLRDRTCKHLVALAALVIENTFSVFSDKGHVVRAKKSDSKSGETKIQVPTMEMYMNGQNEPQTEPSQPNLEPSTSVELYPKSNDMMRRRDVEERCVGLWAKCEGNVSQLAEADTQVLFEDYGELVLRSILEHVLLNHRQMSSLNLENLKTKDQTFVQAKVDRFLKIVFVLECVLTRETF